MDSMKFINFCHQRATINRVKRQPMKQKKLFINHISDKGLYQDNIKNLYNSTTKKSNNLTRKNVQRT